MKVKDCMTREVVTVRRATPLRDLIEAFREFNFHTFPVVEDGAQLVGIITLGDILKVFQPYGVDLVNLLKTVPLLEREDREEDLLFADISSEIGILLVVDDLMNTQVVTVEEETSIKEARSLMKLHNLRRLPVVREGRLVGIISLFDIILSVFRDKGVVR